MERNEGKAKPKKRAEWTEIEVFFSFGVLTCLGKCFSENVWYVLASSLYSISIFSLRLHMCYLSAQPVNIYTQIVTFCPLFVLSIFISPSDFPHFLRVRILSFFCISSVCAYGMWLSLSCRTVTLHDWSHNWVCSQISFLWFYPFV